LEVRVVDQVEGLLGLFRKPLIYQKMTCLQLHLTNTRQEPGFVMTISCWAEVKGLPVDLVHFFDFTLLTFMFSLDHCGITKYDIEDLRSESYLETSGGPVEDPSLSYAPEPQLKRKRKEIKGGLKALQDKGIHITSYKEGVG
jgi:hypothetical protein